MNWSFVITSSDEIHKGETIKKMKKKMMMKKKGKKNEKNHDSMHFVRSLLGSISLLHPTYSWFCFCSTMFSSHLQSQFP